MRTLLTVMLLAAYPVGIVGAYWAGQHRPPAHPVRALRRWYRRLLAARERPRPASPVEAWAEALSAGAVTVNEARAAAQRPAAPCAGTVRSGGIVNWPTPPPASPAEQADLDVLLGTGWQQAQTAPPKPDPPTADDLWDAFDVPAPRRTPMPPRPSNADLWHEAVGVPTAPRGGIRYDR